MKSGKHLFLVTADPSLEQDLRSLWSGDEVRWTTFGRGTQALEFLFTSPPDLLVVDERLPDLKGTDLVRLIKGENVYRQLPVILCLDGEDSLREQAFDVLEIDDFLVKPLTPAIMRSRLVLAYY